MGMRELNEQQFNKLVRHATRLDVSDPRLMRAMRESGVRSFGTRSREKAMRDLEKIGGVLREAKKTTAATKAFLRRGATKSTHELAKKHFRTFLNIEERAKRERIRERQEEVDMALHPERYKNRPRSSVFQGKKLASHSSDEDAPKAATSALNPEMNVDAPRYSASETANKKPRTTEDGFQRAKNLSENLPDFDIG